MLTWLLHGGKNVITLHPVQNMDIWQTRWVQNILLNFYQMYSLSLLLHFLTRHLLWQTTLFSASGGCYQTTYSKHSFFGEQNHRWTWSRTGSPWEAYWGWFWGKWIISKFIWTFSRNVYIAALSLRGFILHDRLFPNFNLYLQSQLYTVLDMCRAFERVFKEHLDGGYVIMYSVFSLLKLKYNIKYYWLVFSNARHLKLENLVFYTFT